MRLSYLGKLPLFFTLGIDMRQFLLGTVQQVILHVNPEELEAEYVSIPLRYGTTRYQLFTGKNITCQFLLGTVQQSIRKSSGNLA